VGVVGATLGVEMIGATDCGVIDNVGGSIGIEVEVRVGVSDGVNDGVRVGVLVEVGDAVTPGVVVNVGVKVTVIVVVGDEASVEDTSTVDGGVPVSGATVGVCSTLGKPA